MCDFDGNGALVSVATQGHAVGLQWAEGDLQLWTREAAGPAILRGDLRGLQDGRVAGRGLRDRDWNEGHGSEVTGWPVTVATLSSGVTECSEHLRKMIT